MSKDDSNASGGGTKRCVNNISACFCAGVFATAIVSEDGFPRLESKRSRYALFGNENKLQPMYVPQLGIRLVYTEGITSHI